MAVTVPADLKICSLLKYLDSISLIVASLQFNHLFLAICSGGAEIGGDRLERCTHMDACALAGFTQCRDFLVHAKQTKSQTSSKAEGFSNFRVGGYTSQDEMNYRHKVLQSRVSIFGDLVGVAMRSAEYVHA